jgi:N-acetylglucosamine-6-phosphate deacetylase
MTKLAIRTKRLLTPLQEIKDAIILIRGDRIEAVGRQATTRVPDGYLDMDAGERIVAPGLVDIHIHGANGFFAREGSKAVQEISKWLATTGTTSWLATVGDLQGIEGVVEAIEKGMEGASVEGIHCEGPFIFPKYLPGEPKDPPPPAEISIYRELLDASQGYMKLMDCSPDLRGGLDMIREIHRSGVVASFAHGAADYELFMQAVEAGIRHVTHTYNVMTGMHHRKPGAVGAALTCDNLMCELNADGYHVHPAAMDVLIRCKGLDNVCLISDMQAAAGLPDGEYDWSNRVIDGEYQWVNVKLIKHNGVVRLAGIDEGIDGTISSSVWPIKHGVHNMVHKVGLHLTDAVRLATLNPARAARIDSEVGSLEPGKRADLIIIDEQVNVYLAMVAGQIVYESESGQ